MRKMRWAKCYTIRSAKYTSNKKAQTNPYKIVLHAGSAVEGMIEQLNAVENVRVHWKLERLNGSYYRYNLWFLKTLSNCDSLYVFREMAVTIFLNENKEDSKEK